MTDEAIQCTDIVRNTLLEAADEAAKRSYVNSVKELISIFSSIDPAVAKVCGELLSGVIVKHNGLKPLLQSYLDGI
jgi:hypothetical protein